MARPVVHKCLLCVPAAGGEPRSINPPLVCVGGGGFCRIDTRLCSFNGSWRDLYNKINAGPAASANCHFPGVLQPSTIGSPPGSRMGIGGFSVMPTPWHFLCMSFTRVLCDLLVAANLVCFRQMHIRALACASPRRIGAEDADCPEDLSMQTWWLKNCC